MSLSKQLYIIISIIFFMIFTGNFIISVKNTKEYLETESITKAQDTATSLGMSLKNLLKDKSNPEIESIINAIANRGSIPDETPEIMLIVPVGAIVVVVAFRIGFPSL